MTNIRLRFTVDERPNLGYDSEKLKHFGPQTGFEPTPLEEMSFKSKALPQSYRGILTRLSKM